MSTDQLSHWLPLLTDHSPFLFAILDTNHRYLVVNNRYCELSGLARDELIGKKDSSALGQDFYASIAPYYERALAGEQVETEITVGAPPVETTFYFSLVPLKDDSSGITSIMLHGMDTSERQVILSSLEESERQVSGLLTLASEGFCVIENNHVISANPQAIELLGINNPNEIYGQPLGRYLIDPHTRRTVGERLTQLEEGDVWLCHSTPSAKKERHLEVTAHSITVLGSPGQLIKLTEREAVKPAKPPVPHNLENDPLTGLLNRHGFTQQIGHVIAEEMPLDVMYIDIDNFKNINDSLGHHIGDRVLREIADRLTQYLPENAILGHLGGDEFGVIVKDPCEESSKQIAQQVIDLVNSPFDLLHFRKHLACSIGIVRYPEHGRDARMLMQNADTAMYEAKKRGRNRYVCFDINMSKEARIRLWLEIELQKAIKNQRLEVWYQPKVDARNFAVCGAEALVRWKHPVEGYISPGQFIPVAERSGLIEQLGLAVMREVFRSVREWRRSKILTGRIAINLSPQQFGNPDLIKNVTYLLRQEQVDPNDITFELTESAVMSDSDHAIQMLNAIKALGIALSIDDFGTGYSSLAYLTRFPLDELKIDRAFIKDIDTHPKQATLVESIIHLGKSLDMQIVAEGIETQEQAQLISNLQCHAIQGFHFYKPMPKDEFETVLQEHILGQR
uniref:putative bifunctional diguanylate cyclase/phosphodiesterase n=1 Tax=Thaumasiovibrio occultus TaxID=1891184 RepID=UPI000B34F057|nr:EAL domain-containing protein [Thaumasiovibrio occultus]